MLQFIEITDSAGNIVQPDWLAQAEFVHRQLRTNLSSDYAAQLDEVFANGARMHVAVEDGLVVGVAIWRVIVNTYEGRRFYVDDLVVDKLQRSQGIGKALLTNLELLAQQHHCDLLALDSGTQRTRAHAFYFREGMHIPSFCFRKKLS